MNLLGKLKALLQQIQTPSQSMQDSMDYTRNEDLRASGFDPQRRAAMMSTYGMTPQEMGDLRLNLHDDYDRGLPSLDALYVKWNEEDQSLAGILTNKLTKQKNMDFRQKLDAWKSR